MSFIQTYRGINIEWINGRYCAYDDKSRDMIATAETLIWIKRRIDRYLDNHYKEK